MEILIRPIITEKANAASELRNCYSFQVNRKADKEQIKKAIESFYGVKVDHVRTMIVPAKKSVRYTKAGMIEGRKSAYKKAIVQVSSGEVIDLYSNI
jgi:large subunit ribosomal protein L23